MSKADRILRRVRNMRVEWKRNTGKEPKVIRLSAPDLLLMTDAGYVRDGRLSGTSIEVLQG